MNVKMLRLVLLFATLADRAAAQDGAAPFVPTVVGDAVAAYGTADPDRKLRILADVTSAKMSTSASEVSLLATAGVGEAEPRLRIAALNMIASTALRSVFGRGALPGDNPNARAGMRGLTLARLNDSDPSVRAAAVFTLVSIDVLTNSPSGRGHGALAAARVPRDTQSLLVTLFLAEADGFVRARIISAINQTEDGAIADIDAADPIPVLVNAALRDAWPEVRQIAASLSRRVPSAFGLVVERLGDLDPEVRRAALLAMSRRPDRVLSALPEIQAALQLEESVEVHQSVNAAIQRATTVP